METIESQEFTRQITRFPDEDYRAFQINLASDPLQGAVMRGGGEFQKARMAFPSAGIGKSGAARVIYLFRPETDQIYLVAIYGKSSKKSLSQAEQNALRKIAHQIRNSPGS
ncbi:MAG: type II toxin-antitoxin system RelE/ParE family toxin [bacterium]